MTDPRPLIKLQVQFGGNVKRGVPPKPGHRQQWVWAVWGRDSVIAFFEAILPYSIVKRDQLEQALAILSTVRDKGGSKQTLKLAPEVVAMRQEAVRKITEAKTREFLAAN